MKTHFLLITLFVSGAVLGQTHNGPWTLEECVRRAQDNNITLQQQELQVRQREIQLDNAKGSRLPQVSGSASENFASDLEARYYAELYRKMDLRGGHIILLNSVREKDAYQRDREQAFAALSAFPRGMQAGGGITPETARGFLDAGASHVIVTSYVFREGKLNDEALCEMLGKEGPEMPFLPDVEPYSETRE